jgi:hypothetical protein
VASRHLPIVEEARRALLNAPFEQDGWRPAVEKLLSATGATTGNMVALGGPLLMPLCFYVGRDWERATDMARDPAMWGSANWRVNTTTTPLAIQHDGHYAAYRANHDTQVYDDMMSDLDMASGCQSALVIEDGVFLGLAITASASRGGFRRDGVERFAALVPTLSRAVRTELALSHEAAQLMLGETEPLDGATILLDGHGAIGGLTEAAERLFGDAGPFRYAYQGLGLSCPRADRHLQLALSRLLAFDCDEDGTRVHQFDCAMPGGRWRFSLVRLPGRDHGLRFHPRLAIAAKPLG